MGWTGVTLIQVVTQGLPADIGEAEAFFAGLSGGRAALLGQLVSLVLTAVVVPKGTARGPLGSTKWLTRGSYYRNRKHQKTIVFSFPNEFWGIHEALKHTIWRAN